jgi:hypothetical protein
MTSDKYRLDAHLDMELPHSKYPWVWVLVQVIGIGLTLAHLLLK